MTGKQQRYQYVRKIEFKVMFFLKRFLDDLRMVQYYN